MDAIEILVWIVCIAVILALASFVLSLLLVSYRTFLRVLAGIYAIIVVVALLLLPLTV